MNRFLVNGCPVPVQVLNKLYDAALVLEIVLFVGSLILDADEYAGIEKRQFSQTLGQGLE